MAYERSDITNTTSAIPTAPQPIMRDAIEIDPYRNTSRLNKVLNTSQPPATVPRETNDKDIGHPDINSEVSAEASAEPAETVQLSPQLAALARKEQKFRREEQELKKRQALLETEKAELAELRTLKAKLDAKDFSGLEDKIPYDAYTNYLIEKTETQSPEALALKKLSEEVENVKKSQKDDVEKRFEAAVQERRKAINSLVETNTDFITIKELKMQEAVVKHILDTWEHDSIDLSPEDAAKEVEAELVERAGKWSGLTKIRSRTPAVEDDKKTLPPLKPGIKTITNNMAASSESKRTPKSFQNMSDNERYAEARRRAEEKLKQQGKI